MATERKRRRVGLALASCVAAFVMLSIFLGGPGGPIEASGYRCYNKRYVGICRKGCARYKKYSASYLGKALGYAKRSCVTAFRASKADCTGDRRCTARAAKTKKACMKRVARAGGSAHKRLNRGTALCGKCCRRTCGGGDCTAYVGGGSYLGARSSRDGYPSTAFLDLSDRIRHGLARLVPWAVDGWGE